MKSTHVSVVLSYFIATGASRRQSLCSPWNLVFVNILFLRKVYHKFKHRVFNNVMTTPKWSNYMKTKTLFKIWMFFPKLEKSIIEYLHNIVCFVWKTITTKVNSVSNTITTTIHAYTYAQLTRSKAQVHNNKCVNRLFHQQSCRNKVQCLANHWWTISCTESGVQYYMQLDNLPNTIL
jgi:hypothetical protein